MKELIRNIRNYAIISNKEVIYIDRTFRIISFPEKKCLGTIENAYDIYYFENNIIIVEDYYGKAFIIDAGKVKPFLQKKYSISQIWKNYAIVYWDSEGSIGYFGVFNIKNNNLLYEKEDIMRRKILSCKELVCYSKTELFYINYIANISIWQFSISGFPSYIQGQEADIKQIIGVYNNVLWIHVGEFHLIGLDVDNGKIVHHIEDIRTIIKSANNNIELGFSLKLEFFLDKEKGLLKALLGNSYIEIDLNTLSGIEKKYFGNDWKNGWHVHSTNFYPEEPSHIFFSGYYQLNAGKPNAFGIFDTEKAEIIWYDTTKDDLGYFYNPPQANDKLLAILDDKKNLLIYERD
jgi:hypothetical protein